MKKIAQVVSLIALVGVIIPPLAYLAASLTLDAVKTWMLVSTFAWFATAPVWMNRGSV
ncbi:MAG: hypothetical protein WD941_02170 [Opitutus sp.]